jgi:hypothetical protein
MKEQNKHAPNYTPNYAPVTGLISTTGPQEQIASSTVNSKHMPVRPSAAGTAVKLAACVDGL